MRTRNLDAKVVPDRTKGGHTLPEYDSAVHHVGPNPCAIAHTQMSAEVFRNHLGPELHLREVVLIVIGQAPAFPVRQPAKVEGDDLRALILHRVRLPCEPVRAHPKPAVAQTESEVEVAIRRSVPDLHFAILGCEGVAANTDPLPEPIWIRGARHGALAEHALGLRRVRVRAWVDSSDQHLLGSISWAWVLKNQRPQRPIHGVWRQQAHVPAVLQPLAPSSCAGFHRQLLCILAQILVMAQPHPPLEFAMADVDSVAARSEHG
mmetsp:Transcript_123100/g.394159  ORF Transcript_123100/g.394159 Transcript_123100/m.394159 type:complete len:263 (-) Transcript_123100:536-1324(-)